MTNWPASGAEMPLVSIIIPTFNYGHFIGETLNSVIEQDYTNWECIVVDNGSSDQTEAIVGEYARKDARFHYTKIAHSTTSASRNRGIELSSGEFIQFLDADDQLEKSKLSNQIALFKANPKAGIVYSHAVYYDTGNPTETRYTYDASNIPWMPEYTGPSWGILTKMYKKNIFVISSPLLRKQLVVDAGLFYAPQNWVEDWEFYLRVLAQNTWMVFDGAPGSLSKIRVHKKSLSRNRVMMFEQSLQARNRLVHLLQRLHQEGHPEANSLLQENNDSEAYLYKLLYIETLPTNKWRAWNYLREFAKRKNDKAILIKFILGIFTRKFPVLQAE